MKKILVGLLAGMLLWSSAALGSRPEYIVMITRCGEPRLAIVQDVLGRVEFVTMDDAIAENEKWEWMGEVAGRMGDDESALVIDFNDNCGISL